MRISPYQGMKGKPSTIAITGKTCSIISLFLWLLSIAGFQVPQGQTHLKPYADRDSGLKNLHWMLRVLLFQQVVDFQGGRIGVWGGVGMGLLISGTTTKKITFD